MTNDDQNLPVLAENPTVTRTTPAAESLAKVGQFFARDITAADMALALQYAGTLDADGESVLFNQAQVMDGLFHRLVAQSIGAEKVNGEMDHDYINKDLLDTALRTQALCRQSLTGLHFIRNKGYPWAKK